MKIYSGGYFCWVVVENNLTGNKLNFFFAERVEKAKCCFFVNELLERENLWNESKQFVFKSHRFVSSSCVWRPIVASTFELFEYKLLRMIPLWNKCGYARGKTLKTATKHNTTLIFNRLLKYIFCFCSSGI